MPRRAPGLVFAGPELPWPACRGKLEIGRRWRFSSSAQFVSCCRRERGIALGWLIKPLLCLPLGKAIRLLLTALLGSGSPCCRSAALPLPVLLAPPCKIINATKRIRALYFISRPGFIPALTKAQPLTRHTPLQEQRLDTLVSPPFQSAATTVS